LENDIDFEKDGPALESHPAFPKNTNVEFVKVMSPNHLIMKVWERGKLTVSCIYCMLLFFYIHVSMF
jgi:diaminopimelate epimerase